MRVRFQLATGRGDGLSTKVDPLSKSTFGGSSYQTIKAEQTLLATRSKLAESEERSVSGCVDCG